MRLNLGRTEIGSQDVKSGTTLLISHPACLAHDMGEGHPERPDRLRAIERALEAEAFQLLARDAAPRADLAAIARVHPQDYIEAIRAATPKQGLIAVDADTSMSPGSFEAALRAAGGAVFAVDEVMSGKARNAFVSTRPPGHHAEVATPMGFCFFNNAAIAARHAQAAHGAERVAIMDFDVHHGNGTQHIFWDDPTVMYASTHQMPHYPGTGAVRERGEHDQIVNAPFARATGAKRFARRWRPRSCRASRRSRPIFLSFQRVSTPIAAIRSATSISSRRTMPGRRASSWRSPANETISASCRCWKAATISTGWRARSPRM